jgi:hypothetical protein
VSVSEQAADHGRRWYHLRPEPRRRADLMGFNSTFWMVGVAHRDRPDRLPVPVVVVKMSTATFNR